MNFGQCLLVLGTTGSGKTFSIRNLKPEETIIIQTQYKPLPFKSWKKNYVLMDGSGNAKPSSKQGMIIVATKQEKLLKTIETITKDTYSKRFKNIIIDDFQFLSQNSTFERASEKGYEKWAELGFSIWTTLQELINVPLRTGQNVVIFWHNNTDTETESRGTRTKTGSSMIDRHITVESYFTTVIEADIVGEDYVFKTNSTNGMKFLKSPVGALEMYEPNDIALILEKLNKFENE